MARKRINKSLVLVLSLLGSSIIVILAVLMLRQLRQIDPEKFVELAQSAAANEDWRNAAMFYRRAWDQSHDARHLVEQGNMHLKNSDLALALQVWREASVANPELMDAHRKEIELRLEVAVLYGNVNDWLRVKESAERLQKLGIARDSVDEAFVRHALGMALLNLASQDELNPQLGLTELETAAKLDSANLDYQIDLAVHRIRQGKIAEGEEQLRSLINRYNKPGRDGSRINLVYARYVSSREPYHDAEPYFQTSIRLAESDAASVVEAKSGYAVFLSQQWARKVQGGESGEKVDALLLQSENILEEAAAANPDAFEPVVELAVIYKAAERPADILRVCEERLQRGFSRRGIEAARDRLYVFQLNIRASEACVVLAVETKSESERDTWLDRAEQFLADARGEFPEHAMSYVQDGRLQLARGSDRAALEAFRQADRSYRSYNTVDWETKKNLAKLHLSLNEPGAARSVLEEVVAQARTERAADMNFWILYGQALFQTGEFAASLEMADRILSADPQLSVAKQLKAAALERLGRPTEAGKLVQSDAIRAILEAKQLSLDGDRPGAIAVLRKAFDAEPGNARLASTLAGELLNQDQLEEATGVIDRAKKANPDSAEIQRLAVWVRSDLTPQERDRAILEIIESEEDAYRKALDLVVFHLRRQNYAEARTEIDAALKLLIDKATPFAQNASNAHHRALLMEKMRVAAVLEDENAMTAARDDAVKFDVDGAGGQSLVGQYHMYRTEWDLAIDAFRSAIQAQSTDARSLAQLGGCLMVQKRYDEAKLNLDRAIHINPNEPLAHRALGQLAELRGDEEAFAEHLAVCERLIPGDPWVRAGVLARQDRGNPQAAIARREALLKSEPDDLTNLLQLARLSESSDDLNRADSYYQRLLELQPDNQPLVLRVSRYYNRTGRRERSLEVATKYADSRSTPRDKATARVVVAAHYLTLGEYDRVEATLLEAADMAETVDVAQALAEFYLQATDRGDAAVTWYDRAVESARREASPQLADLMAARVQCLLNRNINDLDAARRRLDELLAQFPEYVNGMILDADLHARQGDVDTAVASLSRYLESVPTDVNALYQRARHYLAQGRTDEAVADLESIKRSDPRALGLAPRILLARIRFQSGRKDAWIGELESLAVDAPHSIPVLEELVSAYAAVGRLSEAQRMITTEINRDPVHADPRLFALRGGVAVQLNDLPRALEDYKRAAESAADKAPAVTAVLDMYRKMGRAQDGISYYEQHATEVDQNPAAVSRHALLLAQIGDADRAVLAFRRAVQLAGQTSNAAVGLVVADVLVAFPAEQATTLFEGTSVSEELAAANQRILVRLYRSQKRLDETLATLEKLLGRADTDQQRGYLLEEQGEAYHVAGRAEEARRNYEEALKYQDRNWILLNNLAFLLAEDLHQPQQALPYAKRAAAISENAHTLDTLGWIYVGLKDYNRAIAELHRAIRYDSDASESYYRLGEAYRRNGQFDEAADVLKHGRTIAVSRGEEPLLIRFDESLAKVNSKDAGT